MAVPDTNTFSLQDVCDELNNNGESGIDDLTACFANANAAGFDATYEGSKDRLSNFRNYEHVTATTYRYTIVHPNNIGSNSYSNVTSTYIGATSTLDGLSNSNDIVAQSGHTSSAAKDCLDDSGGSPIKIDWYLPGSYEFLFLSTANLSDINNTLAGEPGWDELDGTYWTSTEKSATTSWSVILNSSQRTGIEEAKSTSLLVRPIRMQDSTNNYSVGNVALGGVIIKKVQL